MKHINKIVFVLMASVAMLAEPALHAWWGGGHMTVAQIAYDRLKPEAKAKVDELITVMSPFYPEHETFVRASTWLDDINEHDFTILKTWHYTTTPYDPEGILTPGKKWGIKLENQNADIRYGLKQAVSTLASSKSNQLEKGLLLLYLIHAVADCHQPMHITSLYSQRFPKGDMGGNFFRVKSPVASSLHMYWDAGLGAIPVVENGTPTSQASVDAICDYAKELVQRYPEASLSGSANLDTEVWMTESYELACTTAYAMEPNTEPSQEYVEKGQKVCEQRLVLAGYRLAHLLNEMFGK